MPLSFDNSIDLQDLLFCVKVAQNETTGLNVPPSLPGHAGRVANLRRRLEDELMQLDLRKTAVAELASIRARVAKLDELLSK